MDTTTGDIANHRRARSVSLLGLLLQTGITLALAVYTAFSAAPAAPGAPAGTGDHAALTATVYAALGTVVWLTLALLYDWHRRERQEAIEAERLAADPAASAFEQVGDEIRVAARRLAGIQKFGLPIVSLCVGFSLLTVGVVRLAQGRANLAADLFDAPAHQGWALVVGLAVGFVGFVFARFVSGMAKQRVWASLRGGASYSVGTALLGLTIALAHFIDYAAGPDTLLRVLQVAFPVFLIITGAEVFLNFVLDLYRPRVAGQDPRPAFDSRVLGLLAAPDKIAENIGEALNYQFGVEVSKTWFYRLLQRWWLGLVMLVLLVMWLMTGLVVVEPHQKALILTFGKPPADDRTAEPGLHVKWPWPIGEVYIPESRATNDDGDDIVRTVTGVRSMTLGTNPPRDDVDAVLWTNDHVLGEEYFNLVQPSRFRSSTTSASRAGDDEQAFSDLSLVAIELPTHWIVSDVGRFEQLAQPQSREDLLKVTGQREALLLLSARSIDDVLGAGRRDIADELRRRLDRTYAALGEGRGSGVEVIFLGPGVVHPPKDVAPSFERVVQARQVRESKLEAAQQQRIRLLTEVAPVTTDDAGRRVDARAVVDRLDALDQLRAAGAAVEETRSAELAVQRLLEQAGGEAGALLIDASATRWARHMGERGDAALFEGQLAGFSAAPGLYRAQRYLDAVRGLMRDARVYLVDEQRLRDVKVRFELQTPRDTTVFNPNAGAELQN